MSIYNWNRFAFCVIFFWFSSSLPKFSTKSFQHFLPVSVKHDFPAILTMKKGCFYPESSRFYLDITFCNWSFQIINICLLFENCFYFAIFKHIQRGFQHIPVFNHFFCRILLYNSDNFADNYSFQHYQQPFPQKYSYFHFRKVGITW